MLSIGSISKRAKPSIVQLCPDRIHNVQALNVSSKIPRRLEPPSNLKIANSLTWIMSPGHVCQITIPKPILDRVLCRTCCIIEAYLEMYRIQPIIPYWDGPSTYHHIEKPSTRPARLSTPCELETMG